MSNAHPLLQAAAATVQRRRWAWATGALLVGASLATLLAVTTSTAADDPAPAQAKPALSVSLVSPQRSSLPVAVAATGDIAAWQEASVGAEVQGLRLAEVRVNVGDRVRKGQVLAVFAPEAVRADLAQTRAAVAEAEATLAEAQANAERVRGLQASGAMSAQQVNQYLTAERTAVARLEAQRAAIQSQQLRLAQTQVLAPDAGIISARMATVGAVVPAGTELFRLIRQGRLEWRAEVAADDLARVQPGQSVRLVAAGGAEVAGKVRMVAPTVNASTRNGLVYVDLPAPGAARAGMFARGEFVLGQSSALTLPQEAVLLRDGFSYVFTVGAGDRVSRVKVDVGRRVGKQVEILGGLDAGARVVAAGAGFLGDGDTVRVVAAPVAAPAPVPAAAVARKP
jgi:HlyD family secretion protein